MSENKHTPEPWSIDPDDRPNMHWNNHIVSVENQNIAICFMAHDGTEQNERGEANARRVVACVNACAGISTDALEADCSAVMGWNRTARKLIDVAKQRDELLAALERCRFALEPYDDIKPRDWKSDRLNLRDAHQVAVAAIASVKEKK